MSQLKPPTPGSDAALALGCKCPVLDNEHGRGIRWPDREPSSLPPTPKFWVSADCPLHGAPLEGEK
jgi:hypothetical protein